MSDGQANEELVRRWFQEVWNEKNEAAIDRLLAPDCIAYGLPDRDAVLQGAEAFKQLHRSFCRAFPDIHMTIEDVISAGDRVAARWRASATHLGGDLGFPPTGRKITLEGATICVVQDGRFREAWNLMDMRHYFQILRSDSPRV